MTAPPVGALKTRAALLPVLLALWLCGCASFRANQVDESAPDGSRRITTLIKARTLFDSNSELAKLKALQTDKTQSLGIGALAQQSTGTNTVQSLDRIVQALQLLRGF